jgi:hypothetical protein
MRPLEIFNALLTASSGVTALVATRIYPVEAPQNTAMPAVVVDLDSDTELPTLDAAASYGMRKASVTLHLMARDLTGLRTLVTAVETACRYQRGMIAGYSVVSVGPGDQGSTEVESSVPIAYAPMRFDVIYRRT